MKIFINPGHGGDDCGACGNGLQERDVVLKVGNRVAKYLKDVGYTVKVFQYDGLGEICGEANRWQADLFVSIHCNAFNGKAKGTETYCFYGSDVGFKLATAIHNQLTKSLPLVDRGVKEKGYYVLTGTNCPAVLTELAFIDNPDDAKLLVENEDEFARAVARGITDFTAKYPLPDVIDRR